MSYLYDVIIAVLKQAVRDYVRAILKNDLYHIQELEQFFLSDYGQAMSRNNGEKIIYRAKLIAKKKKKERRKNEVSNRSNGNITEDS